MEWSEMLNVLLGGSLVGAIVSVVTIRSALKKARAEADRAMADAETVRITNTEQATRVLVENIVEPLKQELHETRKDLGKTNRELVRLRKAIERIQRCPYRAECPVLDGLQDSAQELDGVGV